MVTGADDMVTTISLFATQPSVEESNRRATDWVKQNLAGLVISPLHFTSGEVAGNHPASGNEWP